MARFCEQCGAEWPEGVSFCPTCGKAAAAPIPPQEREPVQPQYQQPYQQPQYQQPYQQQYQQPQYQQPYQQPPYPPQQVVYVKPKVPGRGFGISAMVLGIIGLVYGLVMLNIAREFLNEPFESLMDRELSEGFVFTALVYSSMSILALCFSFPAIKRGYNNGISKSGMIMGFIGVALYVIAIIMLLTA